ncbi:MAG: hypothetical protein KGL29_01520 [Alphaproteobacteria bacterium]|nr:hypothetical protein [Alphaproteobacteria bacterium]MDE2264552.1 hypothetical protein [Alphaproteobacteria bacterium]
MTNVFSDEQLSAYLDGAGDPAICDAIDRALVDDANLQARVETFRHTGLVLRDLIDAQLGAVPGRLEHIVDGNVAVGRFGIKSRRRQIAQYGAVAASILIAFGAGFGLGDRPGETSSPPILALSSSGLTAGPVLAGAISTAYSGIPVETAEGNISIELSFRSGQGAFCRKFQLDHGPIAEVGVACRKAGLWQIEGLTKGQPTAKRFEFSTASGPSDPAIEAVIERLGVEQSLNRADEAEEIKSGWRDGKP